MEQKKRKKPTSTKITLPYVRKKTDAAVAAILDRASTSVSVLQQLPKEYQNLPGCDLAGHAVATKAVEAQMTALSTQLNDLTTLLQQIDLGADGLDERNKVLLGTLSGALRNKPEATLLKQITGPAVRRKPAPTPPTG